MARIARIVVPAVPHHVTQRGNRRQAVFFGEDDYRAYLALLSEYAGKAGVRVWAWRLMPNHVHLMLAPPMLEAIRSGERDRPAAWRRRFRRAPGNRDRPGPGAPQARTEARRADRTERSGEISGE